jgi:hypothetical protein
MAVFDAIRELMKEPEKPKRRIGFTAEERRAKYRVGKHRGNGAARFIRPTKAKATLKELLAKVKPENLHGKTKTGHPVGKEKLGKG